MDILSNIRDTSDYDSTMDDFLADAPRSFAPGHGLAVNASSPNIIPSTMNGKSSFPPATPIKITDKPLPKDPPMTPRIKKKVPWKGKNIMILIPRDDNRGLPGRAPKPLTQDEIARMFSSWRELGYNTDGFDLLVERYPSIETGHSYSRVPWPSQADLVDECATGRYTVVLPDLNSWKNYVHELQEAKLRALGVSFGDEEPEPAPSISSQPSRLPSAQYPSLPFTPPIPTSSASSNHAIPGLSFPPQFLPGGILATHSPGMPPGASPVPFAGGPPKYPRQSISFPATHSPYQHPPHGWPGGPPGAMHGMDHHHSPSLMNLGGVLPGQSPYGLDGFQPTGSPAMNLHQRHHSLQYPPPQQLTRTSPRLQDVREDEEEEEEERQQQQQQQHQQQQQQQQRHQQQQQQQKKHIIVGKNSSKISDPAARNAGSLQAEIDDAEYHLEEQLRNELEHEDYNPHAQVGSIGNSHYVPPPHMHQTSTGFPPAEHFANEPASSLVLHHPRPHSRGHSLSQSFFREQVQESMESAAGHQPFAALKNIDGCEIETNPSNLGTPVNMDFTAAFHNKTISTVSNPWQDAVSVSSSARHSSHGSKPSSKFNVEAPEFKFNPTSSFTPGLFNFSSNSVNNSVNNSVTSVNNLSNITNMGGGIQPVACHPAAGHPALTPSKINAAAPAFAPGQSEFSFTSPAGLKFRPDAPSFTPLATQATAASSPVAGGSHARGKSRRADSIFGDIHVSATELGKKSRSFTSIRRSSTQSSQTGALEADSDLDGYDAIEGSKPKRAKSAPLDSDDIPLFAERPAEIELLAMANRDTIKESRSEADVEVDRTQPDDTSFSSAASSEQLDTQATTAAPSETSPAIRTEQKWKSTFEFGSLDRVKSVTEKRALGQDDIKSPASVASTPAFASGAVSLPADGQDAAVEEEESEKEMKVEEQRKSDSTLSPVTSVRELAEPASLRRKLTPKGLSASRFASPPSKPRGLAASRFARSPSPILPAQDDIIESVEQEDVDSHVELDLESGDTSHEIDREPTFEEIDAVMKHFEKDPSKGINKSADARRWSDDASEPSEIHSEDLQDVQPAGDLALRVARSLTPRDYHDVSDDAARPIPSTELEDPFLDPPIVPKPPRRAIGLDGEAKESEMGSDWEGAFSEDEHSKLQSRAQFFDSRVYEVLGGLLASSLEPLAKSISSIHHSLETKSQRAPSSRRDRRSASVEYQESDADDEDDESPPVRRSLSPKRDRRLEQIRLTVTEALAAQQRNQPMVNMAGGVEDSAVLKTLNEIKEQLVAPMMAQAETSKEVMELSSFGRMDHDWAAKAMELEQRLQLHQERLDKEIHERRVAEDVAAELTRKLHAAETRVEAGILNGSNFDVRVNELEGRLRHQEDQMEEEIRARRTAEDQVCEAQRTLRIASEEERRLRDVVDEKNRRIHDVEQSSREMSLRLATVEVERSEWTRSQSDLASRIHSLEAEVRTARKDNSHWRAEAERADEVARRNGGELGRTIGENKRLQKSLDKVVSQLEENERLRESWRAKFLSLQEDMGRAAREVAEENARHIKRDQAMVARREVLEARLQAEAKTRERLEVEMDRLQENERAGMRAVNECRRLEELVAELRLENGRLQQGNSRYQRVEAANHHGKQAREELEEQNLKLRAELESVKVMLSTSKAQHEMLLEGAHKSRLAEVEELQGKHRNALEDVQGRYERQLSHAVEDGRRTEQHLLERLSLATSKGEHLADRIMLLEDKLEITKQAAAAAAQAAKMAGVDSGVMAATTRTMMTALPDKISPQALRESIMVLQEQLQAREQRVEELEQTIGRLDPDAASKISKRDDEISWLRELLSVRHENLQDIISALSQEQFDRDAVKDAAIRLKANLQMEEQERERAMNGGSAISLPLPSSIAQAVQAATPRVAQTIGPIAAAWGNWRKGASTPTLRGLSGVLGSTAAAAAVTTTTSTPTWIRKVPTQQGGMRGGLLTPPASGLRQSSPVMEDDDTPRPTAFTSTGRRFPQTLASGLRQSSPVMEDDETQPTAFASTGRRFPQSLALGLRQSSPVMDDDETQPTAFANTGRRLPQTREARLSDGVASACRAETVTPNADDVVDEEEEERVEEDGKERLEEPMTPPMMNSSVYDEDARGVFDEDDFFEEE